MNSTDEFFFHSHWVNFESSASKTKKRSRNDWLDHKSIGNRNEFPTSRRFICEIFQIFLMCQMYIIITCISETSSLKSSSKDDRRRVFYDVRDRCSSRWSNNWQVRCAKISQKSLKFTAKLRTAKIDFFKLECNNVEVWRVWEIKERNLYI